MERICYTLNEKGDPATNTQTGKLITKKVGTLSDPLWILLGEPGMGKTFEMNALAKRHGVASKCIRARDVETYSAEALQDISFLLVDGLDEVPNKLKVRNAIQSLHQVHPFESIGITSRYADWYHKSDTQDFQIIHNPVQVYALNPISEEERTELVQQFMTEMSLQGNADEFIKRAQAHDLGSMLGNPQLIRMLVRAIAQQAGGDWPETKTAVYELACRQMLTEHRDKSTNADPPRFDEEWLNQVGQLSAIMLLANCDRVRTGVVSDHQFLNHTVCIDQLPLPQDIKVQVTELIRQHKVFQNIADDCYEPIHRSVAEFLAARHIAAQHANGKLSMSRIKALFMVDDGIPTNLRGAAGWLASLNHNDALRQELIGADPEGILNYADLTMLSVRDKQVLLEAIDHLPTYLPISYEQAKRYAPLVQADMQQEVQQHLATTKRNEGHNNLLHLLCKSLYKTQVASTLEAALFSIVRNASWQNGIRLVALNSLIAASTDPAQLLALLEDMHTGGVEDSNFDLRGELLSTLFPAHIPASQIFSYCQARKHPNEMRNPARYNYFWYDLASEKKIETYDDDFLIEIANGLVDADADKVGDNFQSHKIGDDLIPILLHAVIRCGTLVDVTVLANWLAHIGPKQLSNRRSNQQEQFDVWAKAHMELCRAVETIWYQQANKDSMRGMSYEYITLPPPADQCARMFELATHFYKLRDTQRVLYFLQLSANTYQDTSSIKSYPDFLANWLIEHPHVTVDSSHYLQCDWSIDSWTAENQKWRRETAQREQQERVDDIIQQLWKDIDNIRAGKNVSALSYISWRDATPYSATHLMDGHSEHGMVFEKINATPALRQAFDEGYINCLKRLTPTSAKDSLNARTQGKEWLIECPALVGACRLYEQDQSADKQVFTALGAVVHEALVTFHYLHNFKEEGWMTALIQSAPQLVSQCWLKVAAVLANSKQHSIPKLYEVVHKEEYRDIAKTALPQILAKYPAKTSSFQVRGERVQQEDETNQLSEFATLLIGCWAHARAEVVTPLLRKRLSKKSLPTVQRAYCLGAGVLIDPQHFELLLRNALANKEIDIQHLINFVASINKRWEQKQRVNQLSLHSRALLMDILVSSVPDISPNGWVSPTMKVREIFHNWLTQLANDSNENAIPFLEYIINKKDTGIWHQHFVNTLVRLKQNRRNQEQGQRLPEQMTKALMGTVPANAVDLKAIAIEALADLQLLIKGSELNLRDRFWNNAGQSDATPLEENSCRDVIRLLIEAYLKKFNIYIESEGQATHQKRTDLRLSYSADSITMRLPIEIKGDWHDKLWSAPCDQLAQLYMTDSTCDAQGIYLVLWTGKIQKTKRHPNLLRANSAMQLHDQLKTYIQGKYEQEPLTKGIDVFVLDISQPAK